MSAKRKASLLSCPGATEETMVLSKIRDLPAYRKQIIETIRRDPGKRAKALSRILREESLVNVRWAALYDYLAREDLYAAAARSIAEDTIAVAVTMPENTATMAADEAAIRDVAATAD